MAKIERSVATTSRLLFLAPFFAIASVAYALAFSTGAQFDPNSYNWQTLWLGHLRNPQASKVQADNWIMQAAGFSPNQFQTYPYVANGYFGQTLPAEGVGYWIQKNRSTDTEASSINSLCKFSLDTFWQF